MRGRLLQLDVLRACAVLLVLFYHWPKGSAMPFLVAPFRRFGWTGVDLFFVLSGFLVSGLLFAEYRRRGHASVGRFLLRRGLKIYPAFYALIAVTALALSAAEGMAPQGKGLTPAGLLGELAFLQNYVGNLWGHTWSLAVEEHFYLALALIFFLVIRRSGGAALSRLPAVYLAIAAACLVFRSAIALGGPVRQPMQMTHLRIDALAFGVLLSYFYNFRSESLARWVRGRRPHILIASLLLVLPSWLMNYYNPINLSVGLTMLYLGYGGVLLVIVHSDLRKQVPPLGERALTLFSLIGVYSYSIYLWHWPILSTAPKLCHKLTGASPGLALSTVLVLATIPAGIIAALAIEMPFLRLRDRLFPSSSKQPADADAVEEAAEGRAPLAGTV